jgi:hypothetical protein
VPHVFTGRHQRVDLSHGLAEHTRVGERDELQDREVILPHRRKEVSSESHSQALQSTRVVRLQEATGHRKEDHNPWRETCEAHTRVTPAVKSHQVRLT